MKIRILLRQKPLHVFVLTFISDLLLASSEHTASLDYYSWVGSSFGLNEAYVPVLGSLLTLLLTALLGFFYKSKIEKRLNQNELTPDVNPVTALLDLVLEFLFNLSQEQCGKNFKAFMPFLSGLFTFILFSNLLGLVPGLPPPTENFSANLAMGLLVFLFYNYAGFREHGTHYVKQFMGPFLVLAPMFIVLELISHSARPLSLAFRLTANIFGDHLLLGVFSSMVPVVVPALLLFFGLLVACIQSFVFTMLTSIYINMAISHDH